MLITPRERLLSMLRTGSSDRIPWNIYAWLLPKTESAHKLLAHGLSLMGSQRIYRETYTELTIKEEKYQSGGETWFHKTIETPLGTLTETSTIDPTYGSRWIKKYLVETPREVEIAEYIFRHTDAEPDFAPWKAADLEMSGQGIVVGEIMPIPIMTLIVAWMGIEGLTMGLFDCPDSFNNLLGAATTLYERQIQLAADSPAEIIWFGDNVSGSFISPKVYERSCMPVYAKAMKTMNAAGKIPIAHYDGSNRPLVHLLARTSLPVIEAFTPPPMGNLTVREAKDAWPEKVVWVNFPGNLFLAAEQEIYDYALNLLTTSASGGRLVIGCTEEFPLEEFDKTYGAIGRALADFENRPF